VRVALTSETAMSPGFSMSKEDSMRAGREVVSGVGTSMTILDCSFRIDSYAFS
jgi:hypothetical protein